MFDLHILHLPPVNLNNINLYYNSTFSERALREPVSVPQYKRQPSKEVQYLMQELMSNR